ncbi:MAG: glycosyltransferase [Candidatus Levybacteria bacterium]|nr:glycosyltransferase [Candidatus Levybacteria bacterium]
MNNTLLPIVAYAEKYLYTQRVSVMYKILSFLSVAAWVSVLYGFYLTYQYQVYVLLPFGAIFLFLATYLSFSSMINMFFKNFDVSKHQTFIRSFWKERFVTPTIDILLPICGEDVHILRNTWEGVKDLQDRHGETVTITVLDDKESSAAKKLAATFGFNYLVRPNRGEMKKAGNLKYGMSMTKGEFIIIFDADFRPHRDFILELLPYMSDANSGIIQSPQYFDTDKKMHNASPLQYGAGNIQVYFYKIIQNAWGRVNGSICVGSNAIYRRTALDSIGGTVQIEHSEDIMTGFKLLAKGWKITYVPLILAKGICPTDQYSFFKQQIRWCAGSMSLLTSRDFWTSKVPLKSKLPFVSGFFFYISNPVLLLLPFMNIYLLANGNGMHDMWVGLYYLPSLVISLILLSVYVFPKAKLGTILAFISVTWAYSYILLSLALGKKDEWKPTGSSGAVSLSYVLVTLASTVYLVAYAWLAYVIAYIGKIELDYASIIVLSSIFVTVFVQLLYAIFQWSYMVKNINFELLLSKQKAPKKYYVKL